MGRSAGEGAGVPRAERRVEVGAPRYSELCIVAHGRAAGPVPGSSASTSTIFSVEQIIFSLILMRQDLKKILMFLNGKYYH